LSGRSGQRQVSVRAQLIRRPGEVPGVIQVALRSPTQLRQAAHGEALLPGQRELTVVSFRNLAVTCRAAEGIQAGLKRHRTLGVFGATPIFDCRHESTAMVYAGIGGTGVGVFALPISHAALRLNLIDTLIGDTIDIGAGVFVFHAVAHHVAASLPQ